jgi:hypothetical protein
MGKQLPHGYRPFRGLRELRPILGHLGVIRDESLRGGDGHRERGHTFGGREHQGQGVLVPRRFGDPIAEAAPQIDNLDAVAVDGDRGADLLTAVEVAAEDVGDLSVPLVNATGHQARRHLDPEDHVLLRRLLGGTSRCCPRCQ